MIKIDDNINIYFPLKMKPRKQQLESLEFIRKSINTGKKNILLNMPTGSGKSYLIIMFINWYKNFIDNESKFDILTNSKILQNQYVNDFPFIKNLKGTSNYYCEYHKTNCSEGKEINKILKRICTDCPYDYAKRQWLDSDISITNFALFNSFLLFTENIEKRNSNVLIIDEAHDYESVLCDFISTKLNRNTFKKCGFTQTIQDRFLKQLKKIKSNDKFIEFINVDLLFGIEKIKENLEKQISKESEKFTKSIKRKQLAYCRKLIEKLNNLIEKYDENIDNWSLDITYDKNQDIELNLQPIWGYPFLNELLWNKYDHVIFLSGTILDKNMFSYINGLDEKLTAYKDMSSTFELKNRPLYYIKVGKMTYNEKKETFEKQIDIINKILKKYENEKGIIHTVNYEITNWIKDRIKNKRLIFHDSENRDEKFSEFINSTEPSIMVSPSMMTGIDLKDDKARFSIIVKIPYPNISSNRIKSRQTSNKNWYSYKTCSDIIQTQGRIVRSKDDYGDTFIIDESFTNILKYNSKYLPRYFTDSIKSLK
jgi:Rad3-related DNA helicase